MDLEDSGVPRHDITIAASHPRLAVSVLACTQTLNQELLVSNESFHAIIILPLQRVTSYYTVLHNLHLSPESHGVLRNLLVIIFNNDITFTSSIHFLAF